MLCFSSAFPERETESQEEDETVSEREGEEEIIALALYCVTISSLARKRVKFSF